MRMDEALELRATVAEILEPLYAARLGNIPSAEAVMRAIEHLQGLDERLRRRLYPKALEVTA